MTASSPDLRVVDLACAWPGHAPVLSDLSFHLTAGWTALVGANGAGKSTLLRTLSGELRPRSGAVHGPTPAWRCPQEVGALSDDIRAFAWCQRGVAPWVWLERLDLDPAALERWATLSPGERKRWQVGAALSGGARLLLLDEPTNHLDAAGRALLGDALAAWEGVGVVVSHDRAFLDALAGASPVPRTLRVRDGAVQQLDLPCSAALARWAEEARARKEAADAHGRALRRARRQAADATTAARTADRRVSARSRIQGPRDSDARSTAAKARAENGAARAGQAAARARQRLDALQGGGPTVERAVGGDLVLPHAVAPRDPLLSCTGAPLRAGDRTLLHGPHLALGPTDRVHLAGPNGAGKSTLLRALLAAADLPPDRVLHLPQELPADRIAADLAALHALPPDRRGRVLQLVAALGVPPAALLATARPSPGEARKLALALAMGRQAWLLALDEPTNHLDLPAIARLQGALAAFGGALLLVTHDAALADACCTLRWRIDPGEGVVSVEGISPRPPP